MTAVGIYSPSPKTPRQKRDEALCGVSGVLCAVSLFLALYTAGMSYQVSLDREIQVRQVQQQATVLAEQKAATEQAVLANGKLLVMLKRLDQLATVAERNL